MYEARKHRQRKANREIGGKREGDRAEDRPDHAESAWFDGREGHICGGLRGVRHEAKGIKG